MKPWSVVRLNVVRLKLCYVLTATLSMSGLLHANPAQAQDVATESAENESPAYENESPTPSPAGSREPAATRSKKKTNSKSSKRVKTRPSTGYSNEDTLPSFDEETARADAEKKTEFHSERSRSRFGAGFAFAHFAYSEPGLMEETGTLWGGRVDFAHDFENGDYTVGAELEYLSGGLTYDGQYQNGTPVKTDTKDRLWTLRTQFGLNRPLENGQFWTPYTGISFRSWYDHIIGPGGYEREISQLYLPIGFEYHIPTENWHYAAFAELDILLGGTVKSHLSQVGPTYDDVENKQSSGAGVRVGGNISYRFSDALTARLQPYYQYWNVSDSDIAILPRSGMAVLEPANKTNMYGLNLAIEF